MPFSIQAIKLNKAKRGTNRENGISDSPCLSLFQRGCGKKDIENGTTWQS